jgi:hypothetical protein
MKEKGINYHTRCDVEEKLSREKKRSATNKVLDKQGSSEN